MHTNDYSTPEFGEAMIALQGARIVLVLYGDILDSSLPPGSQRVRPRDLRSPNPRHRPQRHHASALEVQIPAVAYARQGQRVLLRAVDETLRLDLALMQCSLHETASILRPTAGLSPPTGTGPRSLELVAAHYPHAEVPVVEA